MLQRETADNSLIEVQPKVSDVMASGVIRLNLSSVIRADEIKPNA